MGKRKRRIKRYTKKDRIFRTTKIHMFFIALYLVVLCIWLGILYNAIFNIPATKGFIMIIVSAIIVSIIMTILTEIHRKTYEKYKSQ